MLLKAHAKINWALNVVGVLENGYHSLDMLTQRLELADAVELLPCETLEFSVAGLPGAPEGAGNLAMKAARALKDAAGYPGGARIHLEKHIPAQAGLGGGSADAAAVLLGLNALWGLGYSQEQLAAIGVKLGADVPLCLHPGLARVRGIGEDILPLGNGKALDILVLKPGQGLETARVFKAFDMEPDHESAYIEDAAQALMQGDLAAIGRTCYNQLQKSAGALCPGVPEAVRDLLTQGAAFAQMSGSGSAVFGVFKNEDAAEQARAGLAGRWPVCIKTRTLAG